MSKKQGQQNSQGMKWFNFFYKFSLPLGLILSIGNISGNLEEQNYVLIGIQVIYCILNISILFCYHKNKKPGIMIFPFSLYVQTFVFLGYVFVSNTIVNPYAVLIWGTYMMVNANYFSKRKKYFMTTKNEDNKNKEQL